MKQPQDPKLPKSVQSLESENSKEAEKRKSTELLPQVSNGAKMCKGPPKLHTRNVLEHVRRIELAVELASLSFQGTTLLLFFLTA
ncbi:NBS-LRR resistance protein [Corchorus olitorius]|uniref:NBS-LRR resistance protein n=1 Tax=Corchorus olitorius TaxID=93759 RepID=A0A1R3KDM1_9ROSI|nr:NBS-LRR resistance protein [Corchorus olitorius]